MKQKFEKSEIVFIIEYGAAHTSITKCVVVTCHPIKKSSNDPKSQIIDYYYDLNYAYSSKKPYLINTKDLYSVPQDRIFKTYEDCKEFVIKNFDTFFLRI